MKYNRNQIVLGVACVLGLIGCEPQDVVKQTLIAMAQSNTAPNGNSEKIKQKGMSSNRIFEDYYEDICADLGHKTGSDQMLTCVTIQIQNLYKE